MVIKQKPTGRTLSVPGGLAYGAICSMAVTTMGAAMLAWLVSAEKVPEQAIGYGVMVFLILASFLGAMVSWAKIRRQRIMVCMLSGAVYFGMLLAITALFFGGQYSAVGVTALLILCGSGLAVLTGFGKGSAGRPRKVRLPNR